MTNSEYICVEHNSSACHACVEEFQKTEADLESLRAEIARWKNIFEENEKLDNEAKDMLTKEIERLRAEAGALKEERDALKSRLAAGETKP